jgi:hypothetical protein
MFFKNGIKFHWRLFKTCKRLLQRLRLYWKRKVVQHHINKEMCTASEVFPLFCPTPVSYTQRRLYAMKMYGGVDWRILALCTSWEWLASCRSTSWIGGWVGPKTGLDNMEEKNLALLALQLWSLNGTACSVTILTVLYTYCHVVCVIIDWIWIGEWIYWPLTAINYM